MHKSMEGIFKDLRQNRREARRAQMRFVVVSLKKDGHARKVMPGDIEEATRTQEEAHARKVDMERMNPGKQFAVISLSP